MMVAAKRANGSVEAPGQGFGLPDDELSDTGQ